MSMLKTDMKMAGKLPFEIDKIEMETYIKSNLTLEEYTKFTGLYEFNEEKGIYELSKELESEQYKELQALFDKSVILLFMLIMIIT